MGGLVGDSLPPEFTRPALVGLSVVVGAVVILFLISSVKLRRALGQQGSKYVQDDYGTTVVRRSLRSAKKPERWEPPLVGQGGATPSPLATVGKAVSKAVKTPKQALKAVTKAASSDEGPTKRGRPRKSEGGEPPKSPRGSRKGQLSSPSPTRTRRIRTPRS